MIVKKSKVNKAFGSKTNLVLNKIVFIKNKVIKPYKLFMYKNLKLFLKKKNLKGKGNLIFKKKLKFKKIVLKVSYRYNYFLQKSLFRQVIVRTIIKSITLRFIRLYQLYALAYRKALIFKLKHQVFKRFSIWKKRRFLYKYFANKNRIFFLAYVGLNLKRLYGKCNKYRFKQIKKQWLPQKAMFSRYQKYMIRKFLMFRLNYRNRKKKFICYKKPYFFYKRYLKRNRRLIRINRRAIQVFFGQFHLIYRLNRRIYGLRKTR